MSENFSRLHQRDGVHTAAEPNPSAPPRSRQHLRAAAAQRRAGPRREPRTIGGARRVSADGWLEFRASLAYALGAALHVGAPPGVDSATRPPKVTGTTILPIPTRDEQYSVEDEL
ncbi:hypothetical protein DCS_03266 [Drechmeria coniospora]|uniref:Uncharacterized protein n=1 Tax=Drechmeria coniospora TaxID=98403 RepID=A0A151GYC8_DRECN|nr:hypothetical protein DCS_03266 [Drechmeria coniospora]KYK62119.1 hypothetical protein DCS_03266 [Drechmeria coniospora]